MTARDQSAVLHQIPAGDTWSILAETEERIAALPPEQRERIDPELGIFLYFTKDNVPIYWKEDDLGF